jgi:hypothetical protein
MVKLSQQATVVALAAALPVLTSTYKFRMLDSVILALTGALAVYNVNCLTRGNCNAWATLVAVSFFVTTLLQIRKYEGQEVTWESVTTPVYDPIWSSLIGDDGYPDLGQNLINKISIPPSYNYLSLNTFETMVSDLRKHVQSLVNQLLFICEMKKFTPQKLIDTLKSVKSKAGELFNKIYPSCNTL